MIKILFPIISMLAFSMLYITYKKAENIGADKFSVNLFLFLTGGTLSLILLIFLGSTFSKSTAIAGLFGGICASAAVVLFLRSLDFHKLNVSTTMINFSFIIPLIFSVLFFFELPTLKEIISTSLIITSIILIKNG